ncbi:hypothetical protein [Rhizobium ruizarguesonis]|uniref:hypothetical protein n=1 Tax=Rhizobium ruizarguesonis TaxID=2081791 RepID=UPI001031283E|nr:hypothetical protein [Rhizobium ruizarguesonis]TAV00342.1 hypothetical protein ELI39_31070 [Rhizobium ruizarguesonis]
MAEYVYQRPKLYKLQSEAFFNDFRYAWIEGSTKSHPYRAAGSPYAIAVTVGLRAGVQAYAAFKGK